MRTSTRRTPARPAPAQRAGRRAGTAENGRRVPEYGRDFDGLSADDMELLLPIARRAFVEEAAARFGAVPDDEQNSTHEEDDR